jgi:acetyltransferase-like isoleucine patch superfamily enzyme/dTDP-4-dehydrorhamnose 3,5-epimerase-like enzyme
MAYFKHDTAIVETPHVGEGTRVWAFVHVMPGARIGRHCNICDQVFIEGDVVIGDEVTIKSGVQVWDGVRLEDGVFVGPNATFTNDPFPRSRKRPEKLSQTVVRRGASIGANATILPGRTIGQFAMVGAGAVVMHDVPPHAIVVGNPAHIRGYVDARTREVAQPPLATPSAAMPVMRVSGVRVVDRPVVEDLRGLLTFAQTDDGDLPFAPRRYFVVSGVPSRQVRGEHAHRTLHQWLTCLHGECTVLVDDGEVRQDVTLDRPSRSLYLPPMIWGVQYNFSPDAVLLVLASDPYDAADYIRDYDEYLRLRGRLK